MGFPRIAFDKVNNHVLNNKEYTIMVGSRQVGKTTLLRQLYAATKKKEEAYYLSFEDGNVLSEIDKHPFNLFLFLRRKPDLPSVDKQQQRIVVFIDEIQYAQNPSNFLKLLYDTYKENLKIVATGSSAFYIDEKFKDSLAGRKRIFNIKPLNFEEYLIFTKQDGLLKEVKTYKSKRDYISLKKPQLLLALSDYMCYGGYPEVVLEQSVEGKIERLKELRGAFLKRDMLESGVRNETAFYTLFTMLASQTGSLVNRNELAKLVRINNKQVDDYVNILQKTFHVSLLRPFYANIKKELIKMPKVYFQDLGLRNVLLNNFSPLETRNDKGELLENYVYNLLSETYDEEQLRFWRTQDGKEIDFIVSEMYMQGKALEVKWQKAAFRSTKYKRFEEAYPQYPVSCISFDQDDILRTL